MIPSPPSARQIFFCGWQGKPRPKSAVSQCSGVILIMTWVPPGLAAM
jgi:hypothetical protein